MFFFLRFCTIMSALNRRLPSELQRDLAFVVNDDEAQGTAASPGVSGGEMHGGHIALDSGKRVVADSTTSEQPAASGLDANGRQDTAISLNKTIEETAPTGSCWTKFGGLRWMQECGHRGQLAHYDEKVYPLRLLVNNCACIYRQCTRMAGSPSLLPGCEPPSSLNPPATM